MLGRKTLLVVLNSIVGAGFGAAALFVMARYLSPASIGAVAFATSLVTVAAFLTTLGFDAAHAKRISEGLPLGDCLATYRWLRLCLGLVGASVLALAAIAWERQYGIPDATTLPILLVALLGLVATTVRAVPADTFMGLTQTARAQAITFVENMVRQPLALLAALVAGATFMAPLRDRLPFLHGPPGAALGVEAAGFLLALASLVGSVVSAGFAWILLRRARLPTGRASWALARNYTRFALPLALTAPIALLASEMDTLLLGYFWSSNDVGQFYAARRIVSLLAIVPLGLGAVFFPMVSELAGRKDEAGVRVLTRSTVRNISLILAPLVMLALVYAGPGLRVALGPGYGPAVPLVRLMAAQTGLWALWSIYSAVLLGLDRPWKALAAGQVIVIGNFALDILFIPTSVLGVPLLGLGAVGAALTTAISYAVGLVILLAMLPPAARGTWPGMSLLKQAAAATAVGLLLWRFDAVVSAGAPDRFWELGLIGLAGLGLYVATLVALKEVGRRDWLMLVDLLSTRRMAAYVHSELGERQ